MSFRLRRSSFGEDFFEILEKDAVVEEISLPFLGPKVSIPDHFETLDELKRWAVEKEEKLAREKVYRWLSARAYPRAILLRKLRNFRFQPSVCERVLAEVERLGYIQDGEYEIRSIEREFRKGYGPRHIECKLKSQGLSAFAVRKWYTIERQKEKVAEWARKQKQKDPRKIAQSLQRRGFDLDIVLQILSESIG